MSALSQPEPNRLTAGEANSRTEAGQKQALALEGRLQRQYESSLRATALRCARAYDEKTRVLLAAVPPSDPNRPQVPQPTVDEVLQGELAAASASARTRATRQRIAEAVAGEILAGFGPEPQLRGLLEPLVRAQAGVQAERLVAGVRETVASILLDALVNGWTVPETSAQIREVLTADAKWRSTMLARTDLIALSNGSSHQAAQVWGDGGPQYKTWLTAQDERVRESHVDANRQTVGISQPYQVGGEALQYPGDPAGSDGNVINCRCVSVWSDSPAPTLAHSHDGGIQDSLVLASAALDVLLEGVMPSGLTSASSDIRGLAIGNEQVGGGGMTSLLAANPGSDVSAADEAILPSVELDLAALSPEDAETVADGLLAVSQVALRQQELTAASVEVEQGESQDADNRRYARALCPSCGQAMPESVQASASGVAVNSMPPFEPYFLPTLGTVSGTTTVGLTGNWHTATGFEPDVLTAAALGVAPLTAPKAWFVNPGLEGPTPLTVTGDGQVFGHIADFSTCHTGFPGRCVRAPRSRSGYSYFNLGAYMTADAGDIPVGRMTMGAGHASPRLGLQAAASHYDNSATCAAYVRAGEDRHGIWVAGTIRPDLPAVKVMEFKANPPSGDWRAANGSLELIAALAVPVPGFPIPRAQLSLSASGQLETLIMGMGWGNPEMDELEYALVASAFEQEYCEPCADESLDELLAPVELDSLLNDLPPAA